MDKSENHFVTIGLVGTLAYHSPFQFLRVERVKQSKLQVVQTTPNSQMPTHRRRQIIRVVIGILFVLSISGYIFRNSHITLDAGNIISKTTSDDAQPQLLTSEWSINSAVQSSYGHNNESRVKGEKTAATSAAVMVQINETLLVMIDEIKASNTRAGANVTLEPRAEISCRPQSPSDIEDILCMTPPTFLSHYKNPCWHGSDGVFQCLPYFQVIGMDKCGSTDLFDRIAQHPDVLKNKGTMGKETMWWSWLRYGHWLKSAIKRKTFKQYINYFSNASKRIENDGKLITGDGTPMDMWDNSGWPSIPQNHGLQEPTYITPHLIRHINPNVRLIIVLRDPVDRLYSDYFFLKLGVMTSQAFHDNVIKSIKILHTCTRTHSLRTCLYSRKLHLDSPARLHLGFYVMFLKDWLRVFPREQMLIIQTESYSAKTTDTVKQVYDFLQLRPLPQPKLDQVGKASRKYVTKQKAGAMKDETRQILYELYDSFTQELYSLLGDSKFLWNTHA